MSKRRRWPEINRRQVNDRDDEDPVDKSRDGSKAQSSVPTSPPPSFHSRASSPNRRGSAVDPALADAFDADDASDDEDETDDRQRLVRQPVSPLTASPGHDAMHFASPGEHAGAHAASSGSRPRLMGGGIGTDGVFANLSARPERRGSEKEEQPPVRLSAGRRQTRYDANRPRCQDVRASRR